MSTISPLAQSDHWTVLNYVFKCLFGVLYDIVMILSWLQLGVCSNHKWYGCDWDPHDPCVDWLLISSTLTAMIQYSDRLLRIVLLLASCSHHQYQGNMMHPSAHVLGFKQLTLIMDFQRHCYFSYTKVWHDVINNRNAHQMSSEGNVSPLYSGL